MYNRVGFLGPEGTYCEEAANLFTSEAGVDWELVPCRDVTSVIEGVGREFGQGVLPIENSLEGTVTQVLDVLTRTELFVTRETVIPIQHCLLSRTSNSGASCTSGPAFDAILSHPQALAQCREYLRENYSYAELVAVSSTAEAAQTVAGSTRPVAAVASKNAASRWGLAVVAEGIQDSRENYTRFIMIGPRERLPESQAKTSVAFSLKGNEAGVLYEALGVFASRGISLTKIESRPARRFLGEYVFYVDFIGSRREVAVAEALHELKERCDFFKCLGSYGTASTTAERRLPFRVKR